MMRLSAALTRRAAAGAAVACAAVEGADVDAGVLNEDRSAKRSADGPLGGKLGIAGCNAGLDESSQDNIEISNV